MEIIEKAEAYIEKDDDMVYDHTKVILSGADGDFYYARTTHHRKVKDVNTDQLDNMQRIPDEHVLPLADPDFTLAPEPLPSTAYVKRPSLLNYEPENDHQEFLDLILSEIRVCEILGRNPHPNIAIYLGCLVNKQGRISGLVYAKYPVALSQLLKDGTLFNRERCFSGIEAGINHLYSLGLIHNDINPTNIMMVGVGDEMEPVIIDFDSCRSEGEELGPKGGTMGWCLEDADISSRDNDLYALSKIRDALGKSG